MNDFSTCLTLKPESPKICQVLSTFSVENFLALLYKRPKNMYIKIDNFYTVCTMLKTLISILKKLFWLRIKLHTYRTYVHTTLGIQLFSIYEDHMLRKHYSTLFMSKLSSLHEYITSGVTFVIYNLKIMFKKYKTRSGMKFLNTIMFVNLNLNAPKKCNNECWWRINWSLVKHILTSTVQRVPV